MNIQITGHQISITPAIKEYILQKFAKIQRHYSQNIHAHVVLEVNKLNKKIEVTTHLPKKDLHIEVENADMYAAIDLIADKMDNLYFVYYYSSFESMGDIIDRIGMSKEFQNLVNKANESGKLKASNVVRMI